MFALKCFCFVAMCLANRTFVILQRPLVKPSRATRLSALRLASSDHDRRAADFVRQLDNNNLRKSVRKIVKCYRSHQCSHGGSTWRETRGAQSVFSGFQRYQMSRQAAELTMMKRYAGQRPVFLALKKALKSQRKNTSKSPWFEESILAFFNTFF